MIAYVRGRLELKEPARAIVEAAGVGYELMIPLSTFERLPAAGVEVKLLAVQVVREDEESLYGFASDAERDMFRRLTAVSGVGPKSALSILSGSSVRELASAIAAGEVARLSAVKGVGKKTAEKIIVELRDKVGAFAATAFAENAASSAAARDALAALTALGYAEEVAGKMVSEVLSQNSAPTDVETIIRKALSGGGKR